SLWWRRQKTESGARRPYPALYMIPLPVLAVLLALLSIHLSRVTTDLRGGLRPDDPRAAMLRAAERTLARERFGGDAALSESLARFLALVTVPEAKADQYHVLTRTTPDKVLVLVKVPSLRKYKDSAREELVRMITVRLSGHSLSKGKQPYIGVKGVISYG